LNQDEKNEFIFMGRERGSGAPTRTSSEYIFGKITGLKITCVIQSRIGVAVYEFYEQYCKI